MDPRSSPSSDYLDRVETNLHTVISEILSIMGMCEAKLVVEEGSWPGFSLPLPRP